jgi:hypothetical protein
MTTVDTSSPSHIRRRSTEAESPATAGTDTQRVAVPDVCWPDPSPLDPWWNQVMGPVENRP